MKSIRSILMLAAVCLTLNQVAVQAEEKATSRPNIVLIYADDLGYGDLGCFGGKNVKTPELDSLAADGIRMTSFYVAQAVCSASRCALLTGCLPNRLGIRGALGPNSKVGLEPKEETIADLLKKAGYATAAVGKWHLGDDERFLPLNQGFDSYFGLPYSNDMWPMHPTAKSFPDLPLVEGRSVFKKPVTADDQKMLTRWYTEKATGFIEREHGRSFFLYLAHSMPHVPIFASSDFEGKTGLGVYADVVAEIDWSVGEIRKKLREHRLEENTLVIFASDNGPWLSYGNHAGSAGPLREGKGTTWEGGVRVPMIASWPGKIPMGRECGAITATIDILPTISHFTGTPLPENKIDGENISSLLLGNRTDWEAPRDYCFYWNDELQAVRYGPWKLHFPHAYSSLERAGKDGSPGPYQQKKTGLELYNLESDVGERQDLAALHPDIVTQLTKIADAKRSELGDSLTGVTGTERRPVGILPETPESK